MAIDNFLNPVEEREILEEMEMLEIEDYLLQTVERAEENDSEVDIENEIAAAALYSNLSGREQVQALAMAIAVCEGRELSNKMAELVKGLRELQRKIRWETEQAEQERLIQRSITHYFRP